MPGSGPPPGLQQFTGYLLRRAFARASDMARSCIGEGAHVRDLVILSILSERDGLSQRALADLTHVNQSVVVKLLDTLEARGLVVRERAPEDRRSYALRLTADGKAAIDDLTADLDNAEATLTTALEPAEKEQLIGLLQQLLAGDPALEVVSLSGRLGYLLAQAHRFARTMATDRLSPLNLHPRDFGVLTIIGTDQPCSQSHLATRLGVSPPAALSFVDELEASGLIGRARNTADRRVHDLTLTEKGEQVLRKARQAAAQVQAELVDLLGADRDEQLRGLLSRLI